MACHRTTTTKSHCARIPGPTDIITYRHNGEMIYVPTAISYVQALSHARDAFPQLKGLRDASLSLSLISPGHGEKFIGISAQAWPKLVAHMSRYQIIDVQVTPSHDRAGPIPDITITYADAEDAVARDPAPPYRGHMDVVDNEKASEYHDAPPQSPSVSTLHRKRSWRLFQKLCGQ